MEGREQIRNNYLSGSLDAKKLTTVPIENLFFSEYKQELGGRTDEKMSSMLKQDARGQFRFSRSAHVSACICQLAAQGHSIQDIMNPDKLQAERQAAGRLYMEKSAAQDTKWLGATFFHGMDALTKQAREIINRYDFTKRERSLAAMPEVHPAFSALFDSFQEMSLEGTREGFYLAAEAEHPGKGIEYGERVCDMAMGAGHIDNLVMDELRGCVTLANPTGTELRTSLAQVVVGGGVHDIMKNSSEPDPLLQIPLETFLVMSIDKMSNRTIQEMSERLKNDPAALRATVRLAQSGQLQDNIHVKIAPILKKDGTPSVGYAGKAVQSLVQGEDGQLHLKIEQTRVPHSETTMKVTPSKSLEASMGKQQKAHEFQTKHPLSDMKQKESKKADPKKEAPQKPAPKKQAPAKGGGGRTK